MQFARSDTCCAADGGNLFDLDRLDPAYFAKMKESIEALPADRYASVLLFMSASEFWPYSPYNAANNIQGVGAQADTVHKRVEQGNHAYIRSRQTAYVQRLAMELSAYSNIVYEVANEDGNGSIEWQMDIVDDVRAADTANPHLVGISVVYPNPDNNALVHSNADYIVPQVAYPAPATDGHKAVLRDTDHFGDGVYSGDPSPQRVWELFLRGYHLSILPYHLAPSGSSEEIPTFNALGRVAFLANSRVTNLDAMMPQDGGNSPASSGYSLLNPGTEYLVYAPGSGGVTVSAPRR